MARIAESIQRRKQAQPIEMPSCGSVFRNPPGRQAWQVIDEAGLRGVQVGGARISPKHCNFIVNEGGATRADVLALIDLAKRKVKEKFNISLQEEVVIFSGRSLV
jgi:UDP-N-acetylmuramate dehydrogenase